jgi:hypothetical protein
MDASMGNNGVFKIKSPFPGRELLCVVSDGGGWEHVSVSLMGDKRRVPHWEEMCRVKSVFWEPEDVVIQFHPAESEYVNAHPGVLHLWRPIGQSIPTPDPEMVGPRDGAKPSRRAASLIALASAMGARL